MASASPHSPPIRLCGSSWSKEDDEWLWSQREVAIDVLEYNARARGICRGGGALKARIKHLMDSTHSAYKRLHGSVFYGVPPEVTAERERRMQQKTDERTARENEKAQTRRAAKDAEDERQKACIDRFVEERICVEGPNVLRATDVAEAFRDWYREEGLGVGNIASGIICRLKGELTARYPDRARFRKQKGDGWLGLALVGEEADTEEILVEDFIHKGKLYLKDNDGYLYDPETLDKLDHVVPLSAHTTQHPSGDPSALSVLPYGKHHGKTFNIIARTDPQYCGWVLQQPTCPGVFREFQDYLIRKLAV